MLTRMFILGLSGSGKTTAAARVDPEKWVVIEAGKWAESLVESIPLDRSERTRVLTEASLKERSKDPLVFIKWIESRITSVESCEMSCCIVGLRDLGDFKRLYRYGDVCHWTDRDGRDPSLWEVRGLSDIKRYIDDYIQPMDEFSGEVCNEVV